MLRQLLLIIPLLFMHNINYAANLDSLWDAWNDSTKTDINRLKAMDIIVNNYIYSDFDSALSLINLQYSFAKKKKNKFAMASALNSLGMLHTNKHNYNQAINYFIKSIELAEEIGFKQGISAINLNIGSAYKNLGNYIKALEHYKKSLKISYEIQKTASNDMLKDIQGGIGKTYNNIGFIYEDLEKQPEALDYFLKAIKIFTKTNDKQSIAYATINSARIYNSLGHKEKALELYLKSYEVLKGIGDTNGQASALLNIGTFYLNTGKLKDALKYFFNCLDIQNEIGQIIGQANTLANIADTYFKMSKYNLALTNAQKGLEHAQKGGNILSIKGATFILHKIYKAIGNYDKSLEMYELYIETNDSIYNIKNKESLIKMEYQHKYEKEQALADAKHQEQMTLSAEREKRQQLIAYSAGGGLIMVLGFAFFIFSRLRITRKQKSIIEQQKNLVEEQKKDITDSINYAENIQSALLPTLDQLKQGFPDGFVLYQPKDIVSGDFYWMQEHNERVYLAVCDCTGHGVPGAFMSMIGSSLLDEAVIEKGLSKPNKIFYEVRKGFINALKQTGEKGQQKDGMDAALIAWDKKNNLEYSVANNPLFLIRDGELLETKPDRQPVGFFTGEQKPFTHHELTLQKGDTIYIFSDGYPDQFGGFKNKKFMIKNFKKLLLSFQAKTMNEQKAILETTMSQWKGDTEQIDDILVMGIQF